MKKIMLLPLLLISISLYGQGTINDSIRKTQYGDAWWARTHGDYKKSERILDNLIKLEPTNPKNYFEKANIHYLKKNVDSMSIYFNRALELGMDSMKVLDEYYSYYTLQMRDNNKRIEYVDKMIKIQPSNSIFYLKRSSIWLDLHNYDDSWKDLEKAASLGNEQAKKSMEYIIETRKKLKEKGIIK